MEDETAGEEEEKEKERRPLSPVVLQSEPQDEEGSVVSFTPMEAELARTPPKKPFRSIEAVRNRVRSLLLIFCSFVCVHTRLWSKSPIFLTPRLSRVSGKRSMATRVRSVMRGKEFLLLAPYSSPEPTPTLFPCRYATVCNGSQETRETVAALKNTLAASLYNRELY
jgi:hypothetical protein